MQTRDLERRIDELGYRVEPGDPSLNEQQGKRSWVPVMLVVIAAVIGSLIITTIVESFVDGPVTQLKSTFSEVSLFAVGASLLFGLAVGFAPSTVAILPAVIGYVVRSPAQDARSRVELTAAFVAGMILADMLVGAAFGALGGVAIGFFSTRLPLWYAIAAVLLIALALINLRVWRPRLPSMIPGDGTAGGAGGAFALGIPFGLLTCPACTPLLLPVALGAAVTGKAWYGALLVGMFAIGRGIPIVALSTSSRAFEKLRTATPGSRLMERVVAVMCIVAASYFVQQFFVLGGFAAIS